MVLFGKILGQYTFASGIVVVVVLTRVVVVLVGTVVVVTSGSFFTDQGCSKPNVMIPPRAHTAAVI